MTSHIRLRNPRNCGNSWYKDRRVIEPKTFCGAEPTDRDYGWGQRNHRYTRGHACPDCLAVIRVEAAS